MQLGCLDLKNIAAAKPHNHEVPASFNKLPFGKRKDDDEQPGFTQARHFLKKL